MWINGNLGELKMKGNKTNRVVAILCFGAAWLNRGKHKKDDTIK